MDPLSELILSEPPPMMVSEVEIDTAGEEDVVETVVETETSTIPIVEEESEEDEISFLPASSVVDGNTFAENIEDNKDDKDKTEFVKEDVDNPVASNKGQEKFVADDDYDEEDSFQVPCIMPLPQPPPQQAVVITPSSSAAGSISPTKSGLMSRTPTTTSASSTSGNKPILLERYPPKSKKELDEEDEREKMQLLVSNFSEGQYDRYEMFRRSTFPKAAIKRLMQTITGNAVSQNVVIAMSGIAKVFVGEVVEEALDAMERVGETGPLRPKQLREAVRRLRARGNRCAVPRSNTRRYNPFPL